jgi:hypothetical protein
MAKTSLSEALPKLSPVTSLVTTLERTRFAPRKALSGHGVTSDRRTALGAVCCFHVEFAT